jgi:hypothetical protein
MVEDEFPVQVEKSVNVINKLFELYKLGASLPLVDESFLKRGIPQVYHSIGLILNGAHRIKHNYSLDDELKYFETSVDDHEKAAKIYYKKACESFMNKEYDKGKEFYEAAQKFEKGAEGLLEVIEATKNYQKGL